MPARKLRIPALQAAWEKVTGEAVQQVMFACIASYRDEEHAGGG